MFLDIVRNMAIDNGMKRMNMETMAGIYDDHMPESLSLNQYELAEEYGYSPAQWKEFLKLKEVEKGIEIETANLMEIAARKSLAYLASGKAASGDVSAAKELMSNSKLIKNRVRQPLQVVITRIPQKWEVEPDEPEEVH